MTTPRRPPERNDSTRSNPAGSRSSGQRAAAGQRSSGGTGGSRAGGTTPTPRPPRKTGDSPKSPSDRSQSSRSASAGTSSRSSNRAAATARPQTRTAAKPGSKPSSRAGSRTASPRSTGGRPSKRPGAAATTPASRWIPAIAAVGVLAIVVFAGALSGNDATTDATAADATTIPVVDAAPATEAVGVALTPSVSTIPETTTTAPAIVKTSLGRNLYNGVFGNDVKALQERLSQLGFAPGVADGAFGAQTQQAVWAYEKLVLRVPRADATGKVTDAMWQGMQDAVTIAPRRPNAGTHVEIYLPEQVAVVFTDNAPTLVIHISSGQALTNARDPDNTWCEMVTINEKDGLPLDEPIEEKRCGVSYTPGGVFRFTRAVQGRRVSALGGMYNPIYFNYGIAMHGAENVPLEPASHGCIRMNMAISQTFQDLVDIRDTVYVWGQDGKEPEGYTKNQTLPVFDWKDPEWVKAQASTTTTAPATTVKATTTTAKPAPTTTAKPAVTTTTAKPVPPTTVAATQPPTTPAPVVAAPTTAAP